MIHVRTGSRWDQPPFAATPGQELIEDHLPDVILRPVLLSLLAPVEPASADCSVRPEMISHMRVPPDRPGRIILLNGTSSSGKTSIAEELLLILDPPHFHMSADAVNGMRAKAKTLELDPAQLAGVLDRTRAGFHRAVAGMALAGNDIVADRVLSESWRLLDCLAVLADYEVIFAGVRCSAGELERRERARGDRQPGLAAAQQHQVHAHGIYDVECDTTSSTPRECATLIKDFLARDERPTAFGRLRATLKSQAR